MRRRRLRFKLSPMMIAIAVLAVVLSGTVSIRFRRRPGPDPYDPDYGPAHQRMGRITSDRETEIELRPGFARPGKSGTPPELCTAYPEIREI